MNNGTKSSKMGNSNIQSSQSEDHNVTEQMKKTLKKLMKIVKSISMLENLRLFKWKRESLQQKKNVNNNPFQDKAKI